VQLSILGLKDVNRYVIVLAVACDEGYGSAPKIEGALECEDDWFQPAYGDEFMVLEYGRC
jgi:hypothetical protein